MDIIKNIIHCFCGLMIIIMMMTCFAGGICLLTGIDGHILLSYFVGEALISIPFIVIGKFLDDCY